MSETRSKKVREELQTSSFQHRFVKLRQKILIGFDIQSDTNRIVSLYRNGYRDQPGGPHRRGTWSCELWGSTRSGTLPSSRHTGRRQLRRRKTAPSTRKQRLPRRLTRRWPPLARGRAGGGRGRAGYPSGWTRTDTACTHKASRGRAPPAGGKAASSSDWSRGHTGRTDVKIKGKQKKNIRLTAFFLNRKTDESFRTEIFRIRRNVEKQQHVSRKKYLF